MTKSDPFLVVVSALLAHSPHLVLELLLAFPTGLHIDLLYSLIELHLKLLRDGTYKHDRNGFVATRLVPVGEP